jgi:hypothetical protein
VSPVWPGNLVTMPGWCWMRRSRFRIMAASWSSVLADRLPRPFFLLDQAPSTGLSSGAWAGRALPAARPSAVSPPPYAYVITPA